MAVGTLSSDLSKSPTRLLILNTIRNDPGITVSQLSAQLNTHTSTINNHIHYLTHADLINSKRDGRVLGLFSSGRRYTEKEKLYFIRLKNPRIKPIHDFLWENPGAYESIINDAMGATQTVTSYHLRRMLKWGLVERLDIPDTNKVRYIAKGMASL